MAASPFMSAASIRILRYTARQRKSSKRLNHIGIVVDDLDAVEKLVIAKGFKPFSHGNYEPGRRFYFYDSDRLEFEVISYS